MPTRSARHRPRHRAVGPLRAALGDRRAPFVLVGALVAVLVAAAATLVTGPERPAPSSAPTATTVPGTGSAPRTGATAPPAAAALLDWADRELPPGTQLRAEGDVRDDLSAAGAGDELLATGRSTGPDDLVLTVTDGSAEPGGRVVARFDELVLGDPSPGTPTQEHLERRRALAEAVLANPTARAGEQAAAVLRSADVDMRLLSLLAVLTAREGVGVASFPRVEGAEGPARTVLIDAVGSAPVGAGKAATARLRTWLEAQLPPFAPDRVEVVEEGVLLSYRYASDPDALVAEGTP
ncbi:hypothetical protein SAMN04515665_11913 [Blastococcus sp. DSM 46786]|uniref:hypothetical protein n=1 Tax=Blastococcus sp. DSM 46786 TaxID=1798227 RepID=UPI0008C12ED2|nr:hypothetical protein [Blastococcus sp. DSM 46786]SEL77178.1 hypothetical protein SAMN04515665_11913 [Blastococcus sp. DSM 46786]